MTRPQETFTDAVLGMVHVALNQGRTSVEIATKQPHKTRLLLRMAQVVLAVDHGQRDDAFGQLAGLELDVAARKPDPLEYRVLSVCHDMIESAVGWPSDGEPVLSAMSAVFASVHDDEWKDARDALDRVFVAAAEVTT